MLPGAGSDDRFVRSVFARPLAEMGIRLIAPAPRAGADVVAGYRAALDAAAGSGPLLVGGISLGAHVAARWAAAAPRGRVVGLLLALPAWTGPPVRHGPSSTPSVGTAQAPAAAAARLTAAQVRSEGVAAALAAAAAGAPAWLATELARAWPRYGDGLAPALEAAAAERLRRRRPSSRRSTCPSGWPRSDDPVGASDGGRPAVGGVVAAVGTVTARMAAFGADPETVGRAAVLAWLRAGSR